MAGKKKIVNSFTLGYNGLIFDIKTLNLQSLTLDNLITLLGQTHLASPNTWWTCKFHHFLFSQLILS